MIESVGNSQLLCSNMRSKLKYSRQGEFFLKKTLYYIVMPRWQTVKLFYKNEWIQRLNILEFIGEKFSRMKNYASKSMNNNTIIEQMNIWVNEWKDE